MWSRSTRTCPRAPASSDEPSGETSLDTVSWRIASTGPPISANETGWSPVGPKVTRS